MRLVYLVLAVLSVLLLVQPAAARIREGECEVCLKMIDTFKNASKSNNDKSEQAVEATIKRLCNDRAIDANEKRFCYYIGGSSDAATYLLGSISKPILNYLPATKICDKLKQIDPEICKVKYSKPEPEIDYSTADFSKMRVKELKDVLKRWGEQCVNCLDKDDYLATIKEVMPKYVKQATSTVADAASNVADKVREL